MSSLMKIILLAVSLIRQLSSYNAGFDKLPSPIIMILTTDEEHTYLCNHTVTKHITWRINNRILGVHIHNFPGIEYTDFFSHPGIEVYTLKIRALSQNNKTTIRCTAAHMDGSPPDIAPTVTVLIQGLLQSVSNLLLNGSTLSWDAPFSLNLTNAGPDIVYCVEVSNITCGESLLISECDVIGTSYTNNALLPGYIYEYTVTPRSNVEGTRNGTSSTIREEFYTLKLSSRGHKLSILNNTQPPSEMIVNIHLDVNYTESVENQVHTDLYVISLNDQSDGDQIKIVPNIVRRNESSVVLEAVLLFRRLWTYTVLAHGCDEHQMTATTLLSTHDIHGISITSPYPNKLELTGYFIQGSTATGVLIAILTTSNIFFHFLAREVAQQNFEGNISNVVSGELHVSIFIVDKNGIPFNRVATIPQNVMVIKGTIQIPYNHSASFVDDVCTLAGSGNQSFSIEYEVISTSTGVCITCTFLDSSPTDCVAVVHQQISQLSSSGLMNIESSHKFNRSGESAHGCITGVNLERYQVRVVGAHGIYIKDRISNVAKPPSICLWCVAGPTVVLSVVIVGTVTLTTVYIYFRLKISDNQQKVVSPDKVNIKLQKCGAYEVVQLSRQRITMNDNSAYEEIGVRVQSP